MLMTLAAIDARIFLLINAHHTPVFDRLFLVITMFGNGWIAIPLVALIILLKTPRKFLAGALLCAAIAGTLAGVLNTQIKHYVHRDRPVLYFAENGSSSSNTRGAVHVVGEVLRHNSFPSGHANTAFASAAIIALFFGGYFYCAYLAALIIAVSRVYVGAHFPFDIIAGAIIGTLAAWAVIALFRSRKWLPEKLRARRNHAEQ
jgi:undecaprenyl-diphosphatase